MSKRDYDSYMDSIEYGEGRHQRLMHTLERGRDPGLRGRRAVYALIGLAACCALVIGLGWGLSGGREGDILLDATTPGVKDYFGPGEDPDAEAPTPAPGENAEEADGDYVLSPADPFDGQAHSSPAIQAVEFGAAVNDIDSDRAAVGGFEKQLTREEMVYLLGGEGAADAPWLLDWVGYDVTGTATYDGQGKLWQIALSGQDRANEHNFFSLLLVPDFAVLDQGGMTTEINGVTVYGSRYGVYGWADEDGAFSSHPVYGITMLNGDVWLRYKVFNVDEDAAVDLATLAANQFALTAPSLDALLVYDGEIPAWRSEEVTLEQAMEEEEDYASHVATLQAGIPSGFTFESGHRELGQNRDRLSLSWTGNSIYINATFFRSYVPPEETDIGYSESLRSTPYPVDVADAEIFRGMEEPVLRYEELTLEVVKAQVRYYDSEPTETEGWQSQPADVDRVGYQGSFAVLYPDGMLGRFTFKGVSPEEALAMVGGSNELCVLPPVPAFTVTGAAGTTATLSAEDAEWLRDLLNNGEWEDGASDCLCDYSLSIPTAELYYNYHADCGTFNDTENQRSLTLSAADRETVNAMLSSLGLVVRSAPHAPEDED